jgi:uncharacterized OsmC-like protein
MIKNKGLKEPIKAVEEALATCIWKILYAYLDHRGHDTAELDVVANYDGEWYIEIFADVDPKIAKRFKTIVKSCPVVNMMQQPMEVVVINIQSK